MERSQEEVRRVLAAQKEYKRRKKLARAIPPGPPKRRSILDVFKKL